MHVRVLIRAVALLRRCSWRCAAVNLTPARSPDGLGGADSSLPTISGTPFTVVQVGATYSFRPTVSTSGRSVKF